jgi:hypothetical protein
VPVPVPEPPGKLMVFVFDPEIVTILEKTLVIASEVWMVTEGIPVVNVTVLTPVLLVEDVKAGPESVDKGRDVLSEI